MSRGEERLWERARRYLAEGQSAAARITLEALLQRMPNSAAVHLQLGGLAYAEDRLRDCTRHTVEAANALPDDVDAILQIVLTLLQVGETVLARRCLDSPAIARSRDAVTLARLAGARQMVGDHHEALQLLDRALALGPGLPRYPRGAAAVQRQGRTSRIRVENLPAHGFDLRPRFGHAGAAAQADA
jgi:predicted Zn-dependent protease